jgi:NADPH-dependent curcumin reductase CurA
MVTNTQVIFAKIPETFPVAGEHMVVEKNEIDLNADIPQGAILIKTLCLSVDPYMRGRMRDASVKSYSPAFPLGQPMNGHAVGQVIKSNNDKFKVDDIVYGMSAFAEYALVPEAYAGYLEVRNEIKTDGIPITNYIGVLGMPGMTAYVG